MPRNPSGDYTLPLAPVVTDTPIATTWANPTMDDLAQSMTDSLSRSGKGGMTAVMKLVDTSVGNTALSPALQFNSESNSGIYRSAQFDIRHSLASEDMLRLYQDGIGDRFFQFWDGTAFQDIIYNGGPANILANDTFLQGTDFAGTGVVDIVKVNASDEIEFGAANVIFPTGKVLGNSTLSSTVPIFSFSGDTDTGIGHSAAETVDIITSGTSSLKVAGGNVTIPAGSLSVGTVGTDGTVLIRHTLTANFSGGLLMTAENTAWADAAGFIRVVVPIETAGLGGALMQLIVGTQAIFSVLASGDVTIPNGGLAIQGDANNVPTVAGVYAGLTAGFGLIQMFSTSGNLIDFQGVSGTDFEYRINHTPGVSWVLNVVTGGDAILVDTLANVTIPNGTLTVNDIVFIHAAGAAPAAPSNTQLVVSRTDGFANPGIALIGGAGGASAIHFGDTSNSLLGLVQYNATNGTMTFGTNGQVTGLTIDGAQDVTIPNGDLKISNAGLNRGLTVSQDGVTVVNFVSTGNVGSIGVTTVHPLNIYSGGAITMQLDTVQNVILTSGNLFVNSNLSVTGTFGLTTFSATVPMLQFDTGDRILFDRTNNTVQVQVGGSSGLNVGPSQAVTLPGLAGVGSRQVFASATGVLSAP